MPDLGMMCSLSLQTAVLNPAAAGTAIQERRSIDDFIVFLVFLYRSPRLIS